MVDGVVAVGVAVVRAGVQVVIAVVGRRGVRPARRVGGGVCPRGGVVGR